MWPDVGSAGNATYRSLGKLAPYRGGDLEQPGELRRAAMARAYKGELILTYGNEAGTAWIANLVFSLRAAGLENYLVIVMSDEHCKALARPPWMISCAWSSWDFGGCKKKMEMRRLWYSRHHYMSRVVEELGLNVAVLDGDMSIRRDFYPAMKAAPLNGHNLIYTLDHGPECGDLNVGFAYCQHCAPRGRAQWVLDEGLRREQYFCGGQEEQFGDRGAFWNESDLAKASAAPHRWAEWASARDQKLYSDVVAGSCCGAPQHRLMFPSGYRVLDQYAFMRQWGQRAGCGTMKGDKANGLQTWWHNLLMGYEDGGGGGGKVGPVETVAIATGQLASGWHGTGAGELAGWSGHWVKRSPAIAHFVGGAPAGGKVDIMQGLNWWLYEADVVAHAVQEETGKKAGIALPPSFFSQRTQRGLLVPAGPAALLHYDDRLQFVERLMSIRLWMVQLAAVLQRTAVDPQPACTSKWIVSDASTGNRGSGYKGKWYTPGWPWPFKDGVGVIAGNCSYGRGTTVAVELEECCSTIFGQYKGVKCLETAHHMVLEQTLAAPGAASSVGTLDLNEAIVDGAIEVERLRALGDALVHKVLWVHLPEGALPPIRGLSAADHDSLADLAHEECASMLPPRPKGG